MAQDFMQKNLNFTSSLRRMTRLVLMMGCHVELRRIPMSEPQGFCSSPFGWVTSRKKGVMLVRILQEEIVDHCVVVSADTGLIIDSCGLHLFVLSEYILRLCGGSSAKDQSLAEVCFLVKQDEKLTAETRTRSD